MAKKPKPLTAEQEAVALEWAADVSEWRQPGNAAGRADQIERNVRRSMDAGTFRGFGPLIKATFGGELVWRTPHRAKPHQGYDQR